MIKVSQFEKPPAIGPGGDVIKNFPEVEALNTLVDSFAAEMKLKLARKFLHGRSGWDSPESKAFLEASLAEHMVRHLETGGQLVDIGNIAAMLWNIDNDFI